jgi:hypothetical protein
MDIQRPMLGALHGERSTGLRVLLGPLPGASVVDPGRFSRFDEWAEALREERRSGHEVAITREGT